MNDYDLDDSTDTAPWARLYAWVFFFWHGSVKYWVGRALGRPRLRPDDPFEGRIVTVLGADGEVTYRLASE